MDSNLNMNGTRHCYENALAKSFSSEDRSYKTQQTSINLKLKKRSKKTRILKSIRFT